MIRTLTRALAKAQAHGYRRRSSRWRKVRAEYLAEHPACEACGGVDNLQVHHIVPYHLAPKCELDPGNLMTLCEKPGHDCHFRAHLFNWSSWSRTAVEDARIMLEKVKSRP